MYSAVGDIFCTPGDKDQGDRMISEMASFFYQTQQQLQEPFDKQFLDRFSNAANAIVKTRQTMSTFWGSSMCTIRDLGLQAAALQQQMSMWLATLPLDIVPIAPTNVTDQTKNPITNALGAWSDLLKYVLIGVAGVWAYSEFIKK